MADTASAAEAPVVSMVRSGMLLGSAMSLPPPAATG